MRQKSPEQLARMKVQGERLRQLRLRRRLTLQQVADALGVTHSAYAQYESGRTEPPMSQIPALSRVLGVTPSMLFGEDPEEERSGSGTATDRSDTDNLSELDRALLDLPENLKPVALRAVIRTLLEGGAATPREAITRQAQTEAAALMVA